MLLESSHIAEHPFVHEKRHTPFHGLPYVGTGGMNEFSQVFENRLSKWCGVANVAINARIFFGHRCCHRLHRLVGVEQADLGARLQNSLSKEKTGRY